MLILGDDVENNNVPIVNFTLITLNVLVAAYTLSNVIGSEWAIVPGRFLKESDPRQLITIISSMFLHAGWLHLVGNMWALFLFGDNVEDRLGHFTYLVFYLSCGFFAALLYILSDPTSMVPAIGASGAIAGVMGAYVALHPDAKCYTWWGDDSLWLAFRTFKIPAVLVIGGWFVLQVVLCAMLPAGVAGIAFYAHIGGFLAGLGLLLFIRYREYKSNNTLSTSGNVTVLAIVANLCLALLVWHFTSPTITAKADKNAAICQTQPSESKVSSDTSHATKSPVKATHARSKKVRKHHRQHAE